MSANDDKDRAEFMLLLERVVRLSGDPTVRRFATTRKRPLDAVGLAHANTPFDRAADRCNFAYFDSAALCAA
jgi:hypothetical protein